MGANLGDYLTTVSDYLDSLDNSLYNMIVSVIGYADSVAAWAARAFISLAGWSEAAGEAQLSVDEVIANQFLGGAFTKLWDGLSQLAARIWDTLYNGIIVKIYNKVNDLYNKLRDFFQPLIDYLKKLKKQWEDLYNKHLKPIYDLLQHIRFILIPFRLLGFKWAKKLDQDLAGLEAKIAERFLLVEKALNEAISWITFITDPFGLFNPVLYTLSAIASIGDLFNGLWQYQTFGLISGPTLDQEAAAKKYDRAQTISQIHALATGGIQPDDAARVAAIDAAFKRMGYLT